MTALMTLQSYVTRRRYAYIVTDRPDGEGRGFTVIEQHVIREVLARTDIGALIGSYVPLKSRGRDLVGLCPFHDEKTPSFHVHPDRGFFKCFGCGEGGNAISFVQKLENAPFPEAVRTLAKRAGVEIEPSSPAESRLRGEKESIYHANAVAAAFFARMLRDGEAGAAARAYCERRGLRAETIAAFSLGFAPDRWDALCGELRREGVDLILAARAGLVKEGERRHYDFYRGRLMIPTYATTGEIVAFGGRALGDEEPKYLNTSTTPVYTKGRLLYALNVARKTREDALIIVEGYLDCIALHQAGFTNAVAALGTAFTPEQASQLRKVAPHAFICFDADAAGKAAATKSIDILVAEGIAAKIVKLPAGSDPDSYVREHGRDGFTQLLHDAVPWIRFKLDLQVAELLRGFTSPVEVARRAEALVRALPREEWDYWRVYVAGQAKLGVDDLRKSRLMNTGRDFVARDEHRSARGPQAPLVPSFERDVLAIICDEPVLLEEFHARIRPERFEDPQLRAIYSAILDHQPPPAQPSDIWAVFAGDDEAGAVLSSISATERSKTRMFSDSEGRRAQLERIAQKLAADDERARMRALDERIVALYVSGEDVPRDLVEELQRLRARL